VSTPTTSPSVLATAAAAAAAVDAGDRCAADDGGDEPSETVPMLGLYYDVDEADSDQQTHRCSTDDTCFGHGVRVSAVSLYTTLCSSFVSGGT